MDLLRLRLIASLEAVDSAGKDVLPPSRKSQALLAYLALNPGQWIPRSRLAVLLWDRVSEKQGRVSLRHALLEVRMAMGPLHARVVEAERERLRLRAGTTWVDALALAAAEGEKRGDVAPELNIFNSSLLLNGLEGLGDEFDHWLTLERQRLENRIRKLSEARVRYSLKRQEADPERLELARHAVALDPTNEDAVRELMRALAGAGQRAQAIAEYERCQAVLRERLDLEPAPETQRLYSELRREMAADPPAPTLLALPAAASPMRGPGQPAARAGAVLCIDEVEPAPSHEQPGNASTDWRDLAARIAAEVLPDLSGRMLASPGREMRLEFADARTAALAAFAIQDRIQRHAAGGEPGGPKLRMGIEAADAFRRGTEGHIAGGAQLAMRLAGAGDVVATAGARDQLTDALDAEVEDLGDCRPMGAESAMRAYRIGPPGWDRPIVAARPHGRLMPAVAVVPPVARMSPPEHDVLGEVLADELIHALARSERLDVISRLSTTVFRQRAATVREIGTSLGADYVLAGVYRTAPPHVVIDLELSEVRSERIVWSERLKDSIAGVLHSDQELVNRAATDLCTAIAVEELQRARSHPLPSLDSYTLMMSAITLMHRMSARDFRIAREMLQTVIDRDPSQPLPQAWMALWYVVRLQQGWPDDPLANAPRAMDYAQRALDTDPDCSLALAMDGLVQAQIARRHDLALDRYQRAVSSNRCHSIAWLLKGTLHAFMGDGELAVDCAERASRLSPLDPHRYFYDSLAATAHLAARQYAEALTLAQRSLRANRRHASTLRAAAIAQWQLGLADDARATVRELLRLDPGFTISGYLTRIPASPYWTGREWSATLRSAGVPPCGRAGTRRRDGGAAAPGQQHRRQHGPQLDVAHPS